MQQGKPPSSRPAFEDCIFCGRKPLTNTHIWPKWIGGILPKQRNYYSINHETTVGLPDRVRHFRKIKRDVFSQQPLLACRECNGGWMKKFEDDVVIFLKPVLSELEKRSISPTEQRFLAGWICLITMLAERSRSIGKNAITREELNYLRRYRVPPNNWSVFVASNDGVEWMKRYVYHNLTILDVGSGLDIPLETDGLPLRNCQIITIGIGNFLFQVFSSTTPDVVQTYRSAMKETGIAKFWPPTNTFLPFSDKRLQLPPRVALDDTDAELFADAFYERLKQLYQRSH